MEPGTVWLRYRMQPEVFQDAVLEKSLTKLNPSAALRTILHVEDNPANLKLLEMLIARRSDLRLLSASTGDLGIELAHVHLPDVILMDIHLPGMSGVKAMTILRDHPATTHIPIIALSANAHPRDVERGLAAGFLNYLTKPINVDELMATLDLALSRTAAISPPTPKAA
jgi:CheY-like chemotaxis protein